METPPPKRIKLSGEGVVVIKLANPGTPLTPKSVDDTQKIQPPEIYVEVQGGDVRFKCDAEALKQSSYFAKYFLEANQNAVEIILTVPEAIDLDDLKFALSWLHKGITPGDGSIPKWGLASLTRRTVADCYLVALTFGIEEWCNDLIDWSYDNFPDFCNVERRIVKEARLKGTPFQRLFLEQLAWELRHKKLSLSALLGPAKEGDLHEDRDRLTNIINFMATTDDEVEPRHLWDKCRWHIHEITEKCTTTKPFG
ncbi:hypothetical protein LTR99_009764 [Exophiala xenobiotica]|uniref:BTB domain-containing protein n=1 Tax=Vermiconidia calcicola TaxID=1690605 RepID=A0AAV9PZ61_9PEZI|nr:hypothetical protein LTR92_007658 [Exophiala xenobiotica]KAK5530602.1 hypothetical protein LTR25_009180 [Vermiconidia calcicola]KAK5532173.1 hypothetical protein LTR23_009615 [Chaetothyriales sp. CCFEE 6169]KAK5267781.1 hypothetical protein LTR96_007109 [Exophiala xenobiotica]KAK5294366.1 hypothetical protein LTR99_009764 [Exophiala xenobiotica]